MKRIFRWTLTLLITGLVVAACDKDDDPPPSTTVNLAASANSTQEVPSFTSTATGTAAVIYDKNSNKFTYSVTWTGISSAPTGMHFHGPADPGVNAGVVVGITGYPAVTTGTFSGQATITEAQEVDLLAGKWYYNVHTTAKPGGEIRGQLTVQ